MGTFTYKARSTEGRLLSGQVQAETAAAAVETLRAQDFFLLEIRPDRERQRAGSGRVKTAELAVFCRQFSAMIEAGLPILSALAVMEKEHAQGVLRAALEAVRQRLEEGETLAGALAGQPEAFPPLMVHMTEAGELGGVLDEVMRRLADNFDREAALQEKVKSALTYPAVVLVVAVLAVVFLLVFVLPTFAGILDQMNMPMPLPTRLVLGASAGLRRFWYLILPALAGIGLGLRHYLGTEPGRQRWDRLILRLPIAGPLVRKIIVARFSRTLATLLRGGVPVLQALEVVKKTAGNSVVTAGVQKTQESIRQGQGMAGPLAECGVFPLMVTQMIAVGEETGAVDSLLEKIAGYYDREVDATATRLSSMIEPVLIVGLGAVVGFIVISIMLPMFSITTGVR